MSGGAFEYIYRRIYEVSYRLSRDATISRRAFAKHLLLIASALHDIEWVDSGDYAEGEEEPAIMKCISSKEMLSTIVEEAKVVRDQINLMLQEINGNPQL